MECLAERFEQVLRAGEGTHAPAELKELLVNPDDEIQALLDELVEAYDGLEQTAEYDEVSYDIWEGQDLPVPGTTVDGTETVMACLVDDEGFRPILNDYRLEDPSTAKGTILAVPSIHGSFNEVTDIAEVFNSLGYNVFTLEPRFDTTEETGGYLMLQLDAQRAIRYIKYHADELGVDGDNLIAIGSSKGNLVHDMASTAFDMTPNEYCESLGVELEYTTDEIDEVASNLAVCIYNYGTLGNIVSGDADGSGITSSRIYSEENYEAGFEFPAVVMIAGSLDFTAADIPTAISNLIAYNNLEDKLYEINWEAHLIEGVGHGVGAGKAYDNYYAIWNNVDAFIMNVIG